MEVKPLRAILIACVFLAIGSVGVLTSMEAARIQGPSDLSVDRTGNLHVRIHQKIFVYNSDGDYQRDYDLSRFGIVDIWGGLSFFGNDDLLLAPVELAQSTDQLNPPAVTHRLNRCDHYSGSCQGLAAFKHQFRRTYRAYIDLNDQIFLSDSASGEIHWLASDGSSIDTLPTRLSSPNKIVRDRDTVVVADTDAHSLLVIPLNEMGFAPQADWRRISTKPLEEDSWKVSQPVDFTFTESGWAVLVKNANMSRSAIRFYDDAGYQTGEIKLQREGFIIALESLGDELVATDYRDWRVLKFDTEGTHFGELSSPAQEEYISSLRSRVQAYNMASVIAGTVFVVLLVVGIVVAVRHELHKANTMKVEPAKTPSGQRADTRQPTPSDIGIKWLGKPRFDIPGILLIIVAALTLLLIVLIPSLEPNKPCAMGPLILGLTLAMVLPIFIPLAIIRKRIKNTRIGVRDEWVIVKFHDGAVDVARDRDLLVINNGFIINNRKAAIGNDKKYLYDKKDIDTQLQPLMANAKKLNISEQMAWEWRLNRKASLALGVLTVLALVIYVVLEFGSGKDWLQEQLTSMMGPECQAAAEKETF